MYSSTPGLTINSGTGQINPSTSTAGPYTITYTIAASGGCALVSTTTAITITAAPVVTSIAYTSGTVCSNSGLQSVTLVGTPGGVYSSTAGLTINSGTGQIDPSTSTAGPYTVTYTIPAAGGCALVFTTTSITITTLPVITSIAYSGASVCSNASLQSVTLVGTTGGVYSSTAGLTINAGSGQIDPSTSTAGPYTVTYTIPSSGGCALASTTTNITITTLPVVTSISYSAPSVCSNTGLQSVTLFGTTGGVYSSTGGLTINSGTGQIDPSTSTAGPYTVTYTIAASGGCALVTATTGVTISTPPIVPSAVPASSCGSNSLIITASGAVSYNWYASLTGGAILASGPTFTTPVLVTTTPYYVSAIDAAGCESVARYQVNAIISTPSVGGVLSGADTVLAGTNTGALNLTGENGNVLQWEYSFNNFASTVAIITSTSQIYTYLNLTETTYFRALVQNAPCVSVYSDTISIVVVPNLTSNGDELIIAPGLSPNNDNVNDDFIIINNTGKKLNLTIFNRWGNLVYENDDYQSNWNGKSNQSEGRGLPEGTYFYVVEVAGKKQSGYLTLKY